MLATMAGLPTAAKVKKVKLSGSCPVTVRRGTDAGKSAAEGAASRRFSSLPKFLD